MPFPISNIQYSIQWSPTPFVKWEQFAQNFLQFMALFTPPEAHLCKLSEAWLLVECHNVISIRLLKGSYNEYNISDSQKKIFSHFILFHAYLFLFAPISFFPYPEFSLRAYRLKGSCAILTLQQWFTLGGYFRLSLVIHWIQYLIVLVSVAQRFLFFGNNRTLISML